MKTAIARIFAALVLGLAAAGAWAQPYIFGAIAHAEASPSLESSRLDAMQLGAGYAFGRLALEASYLDLGTLEAANAASMNVRALTAGLVASAPIGERFALVGKAGAAWLEAELRSASIGSGQAADLDRSLAARPFLAAGLRYQAGPSLRLDLLYQAIHADDPLLDRIRLVSLGAALSF